ncbi:MAG TPA: fucose isomerase [Spirochaetes bacterium]|nr:fucose isomerase [Spirochaetota bacterium]
MLKNIPAIISPDLLYNMMKMGHGDVLVLADGDFPVETFSKRVVYAYGHEIPTLLEAILEYFPLDPFVEQPVAIMAPVEKDAKEPSNWTDYRAIISKSDERFKEFEYVERFGFYERAKESFLVVATGEPDGNLILKKGVVMI